VASYEQSKHPIPSVSIIVPVYNAENYLEKLISSIKKQSFKDFECILVDDKSTDNSYNLLKNLIKDDKRFKLLQNRKNLHIAKTQNAGMEVANGKYLTFIDNDDYIEVNYLKNFSEILEKENNDIVIGTRWREVDENHNEISTKHYSGKRIYTRFVPQWNKFYLRDFIEKSKIKFTPVKLYQDTIFNIVTVSWANSIASIETKNETYYNHVSLSTSATHMQLKKQTLNDLKNILYQIWKQLNPAYRFRPSFLAYICRIVIWLAINRVFK
jgi:glycosyltransferase involved in cell wall biosynthesis